jgi:superfamily II DNA or RNA helicase
MAVEALRDNYDQIQCDLRIRRIKAPQLHVDRVVDDAGFLHGKDIRPYQLKALQDLARNPIGVAHMATNSGKTLLIATLCKLIPGRSVVITHKKDLLYQTSEYLETVTGIRTGRIGDGLREFDEKLTVAMVQSLHNLRARKEFKTFTDGQNGMFIDECHHTSSDTMMDVVMKVNAFWRYGFSGTPLYHDRLRDMQLIGATGPVATYVSNEDLIKAGYSAVPVIRVFEVPFTEDAVDDELEYPDAYDLFIVHNEARNAIIVEEAMQRVQDRKTVLTLVKRLDHQGILCDMMCDAGFYDYTAVNGGDHADRRREVLDMMRDGVPQNVVATDIFGEGVDASGIDVVIMAAGGRSHIKVLQYVGRGMRLKDGENVVEIIDFQDGVNEYTSRHFRHRLGIYEQEGFSIERVPAT